MTTFELVAAGWACGAIVTATLIHGGWLVVVWGDPRGRSTREKDLGWIAPIVWPVLVVIVALAGFALWLGGRHE